MSVTDKHVSRVREYRRAFVAEHAGDIWYGDVMHGPRVPMDGALRKAYLVSLMDDASRLITHSAFCPGETALDIEAVLKRGLPVKLVIDNGPAYRAKTLQGICARLGIHLVYCRPYRPEGKGKLERWHRTFRAQFLSELNPSRISDLSDLNARLWAWIEGEKCCEQHFSPSTQARIRGIIALPARNHVDRVTLLRQVKREIRHHLTGRGMVGTEKAVDEDDSHPDLPGDYMTTKPIAVQLVPETDGQIDSRTAETPL